jgi:uncharacterized damage-inducible protein DinB
MKLPKEALRDLLVSYHYDRRERIYDFAAAMKTEDFIRPMNTGWSSIRDTLLHSLEAEDFWVQYGVLKRGRPDYDFSAYADAEAVRALAREVRARTMAWFEGLTDADLGSEASITYSSGTVVRFTLSKALLHVITHDTHHRGQVLALARLMGYTPPDLDLM